MKKWTNEDEAKLIARSPEYALWKEKREAKKLIPIVYSADNPASKTWEELWK